MRVFRADRNPLLRCWRGYLATARPVSHSEQRWFGAVVELLLAVPSVSGEWFEPGGCKQEGALGVLGIHLRDVS